MKYLIANMIFLICENSFAWELSKSKDKMDDTTTIFIEQNSIHPVWNNKKATLTILCDKNSVQLRVFDPWVIDASISETIQIRIDKQKPFRVVADSYSGHKSIGLRSDTSPSQKDSKSLLKKVREGLTLIVEYYEVTNILIQAEFPLKGLKPLLKEHCKL